MIERHEGRQQVVCDFCPAAFPQTYAEDDFRIIIADAKGEGWSISPAKPNADSRDTSDLFMAPPRVAGKAKHQPYTHACPACRPELSSKGKPAPQGRLF